MKRGRPRKLSAYMERVMLEEVRMSRYFMHKNIAKRYDMSPKSLQDYLKRARLEGRLI